MRRIRGICIYKGCSLPHHARDYCNTHYRRLMKHGSASVQNKNFHGLRDIPEYRVWSSIKYRTSNPASADYQRWYGSRGISICNEWKDSFTAFITDMGRRPSPKHSIERIDNNKGYEPSNCKWATAKEQANNRRVRTEYRRNERGMFCVE